MRTRDVIYSPKNYLKITRRITLILLVFHAKVTLIFCVFDDCLHLSSTNSVHSFIRGESFSHGIIRDKVISDQITGIFGIEHVSTAEVMILWPNDCFKWLFAGCVFGQHESLRQREVE